MKGRLKLTLLLSGGSYSMKLIFWKIRSTKGHEWWITIKAFFRGAVSVRKIVLEQRNLFGLKIEFLYWCIYVFHHPLGSVHPIIHYASHFSSSPPAYPVPFYTPRVLFLKISCISMRANTVETSPPVNHGQSFKLSRHSDCCFPFSLHLNRSACCGCAEVVSMGTGELPSVLSIHTSS